MATGTRLVDMVYGVRAEAGYSLKEAHGQSQRDTIVYRLQSKQRQLWMAHDWPLHHRYWDEDVPAFTRYLNYPDAIDPDRVDYIERIWNTRFQRLDFRITAADYSAWNSDLNQASMPIRKWDHRYFPDMQADQKGQIEFWPIPSDDTKVRIWGHERLSPLVDDEDLSTLDGDMLVLYVAGALLARNNKTDADIKLREADNIRRHLLGQASDRNNVQSYGIPREFRRWRPTRIDHVTKRLGS